ncbi:hypothetical protein, partial [uncultured Muribaculum sp.]|uniref:hypothetical protein n=1 Tax=uncultured Muribaculum sp. TaxID=1918613 RepID=UPI002630376E
MNETVRLPIFGKDNLCWPVEIKFPVDKISLFSCDIQIFTLKNMFYNILLLLLMWTYSQLASAKLAICRKKAF